MKLFVRTLLSSSLLLCTLFVLRTQAQEAFTPLTPKVYKNDFGINGTYLITQFLPFNTSTSNFNSPYLFTYRRLYTKGAFRLQAGANYSGGDNVTNENPISKSQDHRVRSAVGYEFHESLGKRFDAFYGGDVLANYTYVFYQFDVDEESTIQQETERLETGIAPFLGIRFHINERLSLSTESSLSITYAKTSRGEYNFPAERSANDVNLSATGYDTRFLPLSQIFLRIAF